MRRKVAIGLVCWILGAALAPPFAAAENASATAQPSISPQSERERAALRWIAAALAPDSEAWRLLAAYRLDAAQLPDALSIPEMRCRIDALARFIACYGAATASGADAERRFAELIAELREELGGASWSGAETAPRLDALRSYTWAERNSGATIDLDIIARDSPERDTSYLVTLFAWSPLAPEI